MYETNEQVEGLNLRSGQVRRVLLLVAPTAAALLALLVVIALTLNVRADQAGAGDSPERGSGAAGASAEPGPSGSAGLGAGEPSEAGDAGGTGEGEGGSADQPGTGDQGTGNQGTGNQGTGNQGTGNQGTGNQGGPDNGGQDSGGQDGGSGAGDDEPEEPEDPDDEDDDPELIPIDPSVLFPAIVPTVDSVSPGLCPNPVTAAGKIQITATEAWYPMTVEYRWVRSGGHITHKTSFPVNGNATIPVSESWIGADPGWLQLEVTSPVSVISEKVNFTGCATATI